MKSLIQLTLVGTLSGVHRVNPESYLYKAIEPVVDRLSEYDIVDMGTSRYVVKRKYYGKSKTIYLTLQYQQHRIEI